MISPATSLFYDLHKDDSIGHKIISLMEISNGEFTPEYIQNKFALTLNEYPHFGKRIVDNEWREVSIQWDKQIEETDEEKEVYLQKIMNTPFDSEIPAWKYIIVKKKTLIFMCDHSYGDGKLISDAIKFFFDDKSVNKECISKNKKKVSLYFKVFIFLKILYTLYNRFLVCDINNSFTSTTKTINIATLSLQQFKEIKKIYETKKGSSVTINDLIHSILVKMNSLYFQKDVISSAAMFNRRTSKDDLTEQNKIGYILLANSTKDCANGRDLLQDVHNFMLFYKETPAVFLITTFLEWYYWWNPIRAKNLLQVLNSSVDFIISNHVFEYENKTVNNGCILENMYAMVTPCNSKQLYSITSYNDKMNIILTYKNELVDGVKMKSYFSDAFDFVINK